MNVILNDSPIPILECMIIFNRGYSIKLTCGFMLLRQRGKLSTFCKHKDRKTTISYCYSDRGY